MVCSISALRFHDVGKQLPAEVWIAVPRGSRVPRVSAPPLRIVNISTAVFDLGIEEHRIEGQTVLIYSLARTVADCFRFRNKVGLDVALEALTEAWRSKRLKLDELNRIAKEVSRTAGDAALPRNGCHVKRGGPKNIVASSLQGP